MKTIVFIIFLILVPCNAEAFGPSLPVMPPFNSAPFYFEPQMLTPLASIDLPTLNPTPLELSVIDDALAVWGELAMTGDVSTSLYMTPRYNRFREANPLLGPAPPAGTYYMVWGGMTALNAVVLLAPLPHWFKETFFFGEGSIETGVVAHNLSGGLHFSF